MAKPAPTINSLAADALREKFGLSRSYAFELVNRKRKPSLELAVKIEAEFGVPVSAWLDPAPPEAA